MTVVIRNDCDSWFKVQVKAVLHQTTIRKVPGPAFISDGCVHPPRFLSRQNFCIRFRSIESCMIWSRV